MATTRVMMPLCNKCGRGGTLSVTIAKKRKENSYSYDCPQLDDLIIEGQLMSPTYFAHVKPSSIMIITRRRRTIKPQLMEGCYTTTISILAVGRKEILSFKPHRSVTDSILMPPLNTFNG